MIFVISIIGYLVINLLLMQVDASGCDSCGNECIGACKTRYFRTCCFNYLRKRSAPELTLEKSSAENGFEDGDKELERLLGLKLFQMENFPFKKSVARQNEIFEGTNKEPKEYYA